MWKKEFKDLKNLLNYKTFDKLKTAAQNHKKIYFMRYVNGKIYKYKIVNYKGLTGSITQVKINI